MNIATRRYSSLITHHSSLILPRRRSLDEGGVPGLEEAAAVGGGGGAGALGRDEERVVVRLEARDADVDLRAVEVFGGGEAPHVDDAAVGEDAPEHVDARADR